MAKIIPKLKDLCQTMEFFGVQPGQLTVSSTNIDDIFRILAERGITEIIVDWKIMHLIAAFVAANVTCQCQKEHGDTEWSWAALKIIQEGKVDKYLGVKLVLE